MEVRARRGEARRFRCCPVEVRWAALLLGGQLIGSTVGVAVQQLCIQPGATAASATHSSASALQTTPADLQTTPSVACRLHRRLHARAREHRGSCAGCCWIRWQHRPGAWQCQSVSIRCRCDCDC